MDASTALVLTVDAVSPEPSILARAAARAGEGGIVAYPTETFYALGAHPGRHDALERLVRTKDRDPGKPFLLVVDALERVDVWISRRPTALDTVATRFWPGPLTVVLPAVASLHPSLRGPGGGVALRVSGSTVARRLAAACGGAITGTSANRAGGAPCRRADQVVALLGTSLAAVVDAGPAPGGPASTVLDLTREPARILREGAVPAGALAACIRLV